MAAAYGARPRLAKAAATCFMLLALACGPASARQTRLLAFGDSLTAGYGLPHEDGFEAQLQAALRKSGHDVTVLDGGVSGDTTAGGAARLDWSLADNPDCALVELGANDGLRGLDPAAMQTSLATILDRLAARHVPTLLSGMYAPPNLGKTYDDAFRAVFDRLSQRSGLLYDPFFLQDVALDPSLKQPDGLHPTAKGVAIIVARLLPLVERLLAEVPAQ
jgi:acyl-CoA thioesterase-1